MNLVIDVGNTNVKIALFNNELIHHEAIFGREEVLKELSAIQNKFSVSKAIISNVAEISSEQLHCIQRLFSSLLILTSNTPVPFENNYKTKGTLGVDRIALIVAAFYEYPNRNILVIDAGTCITYDFLDGEGVYHGGAISPGLDMRYKALHNFTAKLPLLSITKPQNLLGDSTESSIHSGVVNGVLEEIKGVIHSYKQKNEKFSVVLTGGDTYFLAKQLKNGIFANQKFLLKGLNAILNYNTIDE